MHTTNAPLLDKIDTLNEIKNKPSEKIRSEIFGIEGGVYDIIYFIKTIWKSNRFLTRK